MAQARSFLSTLFDLSFSEFVTAKLVRVLYIFGIAGLGLMSVITLLGALQQDGVKAFGALILVPIGFLVGVTVLRIWMELAIVAFRIADNTAETAHHAGTIASNTRPVEHSIGAR
jgi:hypothetical protein